MARPDAPAVAEPHPDPPPDLPHRPLPTARCASTLYRVHPANRDAKYFGASRANRWDAPAGEFKVLYAAATPFGAFAETVLPAPGPLAAVAVSASGASVPVSATMVMARALTSITIKAALQCVDLSGPGLARIGADARLTSGPHEVSQRWSAVLWAHPAAPDGILYRSRRDPAELAVAIYHRAAGKIGAQVLGGLKDPQHKGLLAQIYSRYRIAEIP